jgi:hypothetical protein
MCNRVTHSSAIPSIPFQAPQSWAAIDSSAVAVIVVVGGDPDLAQFAALRTSQAHGDQLTIALAPEAGLVPVSRPGLGKY